MQKFFDPRESGSQSEASQGLAAPGLRSMKKGFEICEEDMV